MCKVGYRQSTGSDCHSLKRDMFEIIDKMNGDEHELDELDRRFSDNEPFLKACCTTDPQSPSFLQFDEMLYNCKGICLLGNLLCYYYCPLFYNSTGSGLGSYIGC